MILLLKSVRDEANYREIAGLWLGLASVLGVLGLLIASLAMVWIAGEFSRGETTLIEFAVHLLFSGGFIAGPALGWLVFARRRYWAAMALGAWPVIVAAAGFVNLAR